MNQYVETASSAISGAVAAGAMAVGAVGAGAVAAYMFEVKSLLLTIKCCCRGNRVISEHSGVFVQCIMVPSHL